MRIRTLSLLAVAALSLAACSNDQSDVADAFIEQAADEGMTLDKTCVSGIAEGLTDDDVKSLEEGSDQITSPEGEVLLARMAIECGTPEEVANIFLSDLPVDGSIDKACVAESLQAADLSAGIDEPLAAAVTECLAG
jgi:hypothetical protein